MSDELLHVGTPRHSGRYPWGSGEDPEQRGTSIVGRAAEMRKKGMSDVEICRALNITTSELRKRRSLAKDEIKIANVAQAQRLKDKGYSNIKIGEMMGRNESVIRDWLDPVAKERANITSNTANMLKDAVEQKGYIDIGVGVERYIGISRTKLQTAVSKLKTDEGYLVTYVPVKQLGTGHETSVMVLSKPEPKAIEVMKLKNKGLDHAEISNQLGIDPKEVNDLIKASHAKAFQNQENIKMIDDHYTEDGGRSFLGVEPPRSIDSKRIMIQYGDKGGKDKDGVMELRRGVEDLSLRTKRYAQVRVAVDGTHYLKGMAIYRDDMPPGVDVIYNTNKASGTPKEKVFKSMATNPKTGEVDMDNPFGATVRQNHYTDKKGKDHLSALNIVNEEGDWGEWSKTLSSQMLSKQSPSIAERQLGIAYKEKKEEYDEIMSLTNPTVKKFLLYGSNGQGGFAADCDSSAVHLKAASMPRQSSRVILPIPSMKDTEIYAPSYRNGEKVVLIRYPHGGTFEIPELTVNNNHKVAKGVLGQAIDAVGIHPSVAERLSGADFDGDTVLVIPNNSRSITSKEPSSKSPLYSLKTFDPKESYKPYDGMQTIDGGIWDAKKGEVDYRGRAPITRTKQMKMGDVSNLITDMTIKGANESEIARAVKHSMVVIDAEKHHLDYKRSYDENNIAGLKQRYQGGATRGASTLISKASSDKRMPIRKETIDPETGKKLYEYKPESYVKKTITVKDPVTGKNKNISIYSAQAKKILAENPDTPIKEHSVFRTIKSTKMAEEEDAFALSSGTPMETIYANHANKLKALANESRKEAIKTPPMKSSTSAKSTYAVEVATLDSKLNAALKNAPLERQAQILANSILASKRGDNPDMDAAELKKKASQALGEARTRMDAKKIPVEITDREWEAIQAGAISNNKLMQILSNTDIEEVKRLATPRSSATITPVQEQRIISMLKSGATQAEIADSLGLSTTTVTKVMNT